MATRYNTLRRKDSFSSRFIKAWQKFFAPDDLLSLLIVIVMLAMPALSLQAADWPIARSVMIPIIILSALTGLILARSQFNELLALIASTTYGLCFVILIAAQVQSGSIFNVYDVFVRTVTWFADATGGGINQDDLVFTLLVAVLFWFLGYNAAWHMFRIDRVWRVILPPGLIIVTNGIFYPGERDLNLYLAVFMFCALLLIVRSHLDAKEWDWYINGIRAPRRLRLQFLYVGAALAAITLLAAWITPSGQFDERLENFQEFLQSDPLSEMSEFWNRLFSPVEALGPTSADYYGGDNLDLGGAIRLGDQTVFLVSTEPGRRYYWRSRIFDTYEAGSWSSAANIRLTDSQPPLDVTDAAYAARIAVRQEFTVGLNSSRLVYTAPQPLQVDLPTRSDLSYTAPEGDPSRIMNVSVIRPLRVIRRGETYTATSLMTTATANQLRLAGIDYPEWVRNLYFYVSPSVTERTRQLARQIVTDAVATNPYDQARAIESWLRANIVYNEAIPAPPINQDPVDWLLFTYGEGYCNYYASAMIVMLRSLGIPARMAAGFAQGTWDPAQNAYVVTERDAHTWVEVFFPGYGWIEFEPTAAQAPLEREGDSDEISEQQVAPPPPPPTVTPTPMPSPTPEASATPDMTATPDTAVEDNPPIQPTPTITPTFTPTPTVTPVIVPTQPAPISPQPQSPLSFILPALGVALLIILLLVLLVLLGLFTWWWWEWRGMKGLSPIARAYARLERYLGLIGIRFGSQETPEERRRQITRNLPKAERPVTAITRLYMTERYGPGAKHPAEAQRQSDIVEEAWPDARSSILQRWARRLIPWLRNK